MVVVTPTYPPPPIVLTAPVVAETNVWVYWSLAEDAPTLTWKVFVVALLTVRYWPEAGSVGRGYGWLDPWLSFEQVNVIPLSSITTASPFANPWLAIVMTNSPFAGLYVAFVGVPTTVFGHLNSNPFNLTVFGLSKPNPWTVFVVTVIIPVILSYAAVWIPRLNPDDVPIPTILVNPPALFLNAFTFAPCNGAYPRPAVDPRDIIIPPLGTWFWLISESDIIKSPFVEVIPVNSTVEIPAVVSDINS